MSADAALNRIAGAQGQINAALNTNGRISLLYPNGVAFGPGAQLNMDCLAVATQAIEIEHFMNGRFHFKPTESPLAR
ncbi:filamentous hemagglutinin N-terminal domain-containing protein [Pseudomonas sp. JAI115]|uniref:two-partner secretion domain-containing protein n=1 Tax=Pseudomonas sp. JAI115 TaxID=2723061 RepID=UPI001613CC00